MMIELENFRIELNSVIENYRQKYKIPAYIISGILAEEYVRIKDAELAELSMTYAKKENNKDD